MPSFRLAPSLVAALFALTTAAHAQERVAVRGTITEMGSARALVAAEVGIPDLDLWTFTDASGAFVLERVPQGRYALQVQQLGYQSQGMELLVSADMESVRIELYPDPVVLQGLNAQVDRLRSRRNAIPYATRAVDSEDIAGAITVVDAIRRSGEILTTCGSGFGNYLNYCLYRRGRPVRPEVYIDERPAFGLDELDAYPVQEFHSIEVIGHRMIRAYTRTFMERLAMGRTHLMPVLLF